MMPPGTPCPPPAHYTRREVCLQLWLFARVFETGYFRSIFDPNHFSVEPDQTPEEALSARRAGAEKLMGMGPRILQGDMAEVMAATKDPAKDTNLTTPRQALRADFGSAT